MPNKTRLSFRRIPIDPEELQGVPDTYKAGHRRYEIVLDGKVVGIVDRERERSIRARPDSPSPYDPRYGTWVWFAQSLDGSIRTDSHVEHGRATTRTEACVPFLW